MSLRRGFKKHWFAVEATPIYVIVVGALGGAGWYLGRLALRPEGASFDDWYID